MSTFSWQKTFVDNSKPYINAAFLNSLQDSLESMYQHSSPQYLNGTGSSGSNYILNTADDTIGEEPDKPYIISFIPNADCNDSATVTVPYGNGKTYPIYSTETDSPVEAGVIKKNSAVYMVVAQNTSGQTMAYISYGMHLAKRTSRIAGYFDTLPVGDNAPLVGGEDNNLNYNGTMHATAFYGAVYNPTSADFAEGYPVTGDCEPGDIIAINPDGTFSKNEIRANNRILGIVSDEYAMLVGTQFGSTPIAECGRVHAKVKGTCSAGDFLIADGNVLTFCSDKYAAGSIVVAQALEPKISEGVDKILVRIYRR